MHQPNTIVRDPAALAAALELAKGDYQLGLLRGDESLSGSTLTGKAASYGGKYKASRKALLSRMSAAGIVWSEERGEHGKRILVIGAATAAEVL